MNPITRAAEDLRAALAEQQAPTEDVYERRDRLYDRRAAAGRPRTIEDAAHLAVLDHQARGALRQAAAAEVDRVADEWLAWQERNRPADGWAGGELIEDW